MVTTGNISDVKFRRNIERLNSKDARVVSELLAEIGAEHSIQTIIDTKLSRYVEIDDTALSMTDGDLFPVIPLHEVMGCRR